MKFWRGAFLTCLMVLLLSSLVSGSSAIRSSLTPIPKEKGNDYWPENEWRRSTPEEQGVDSEPLSQMVNVIVNLNMNIHSFLIIRNGYLITDACFYPYQKDYKHAINSCTKSITSALIGSAIHEGYIKTINAKVLPYFPEVKIDPHDTGKSALTIKHLLTMTTGLEWLDDFSYESMRQSDHPYDYIFQQPTREQPWTKFNDNSGASHLLSGIIQRTTGQSALDYGRAKLFGPLGIHDIYWMSDHNGVNFGGGSLYMTPYDMAKFGYLYLKKGRWEGKQIIPEAWVNESTQKQVDLNGGLGKVSGYGYQWWLNSREGYFANGRYGQYILVLPKYEMVVVFTSSLSDHDFMIPQVLVDNYIIPAIRSAMPILPKGRSQHKLDVLLKMGSRAPKPKPIPPMPEIAKPISGKTYRMNDASLFSLSFKNDRECQWTFGQNGIQYQIPVSLDDVFRVVDLGKSGPFPDHNKVAIKGKWIDKQTFVIFYRGLADDEELMVNYTFNGKEVDQSIVSNTSWTTTFATDKGVLQE